MKLSTSLQSLLNSMELKHKVYMVYLWGSHDWL